MDETNNQKPYVEIEDELNDALEKVGKSKGEKEDIEAVLTVQELLEQLKIDEFEKMYITTAAQSSSPSQEEASEEEMDKVRTLAEYELAQKPEEEEISLEEQEKLKATSNFYLIPHTVTQRYTVGNVEEKKEIEIYTINDVEGYSLFTVIDNQNVSMTSSFRAKIAQYLQENYPEEVASGRIQVEEVIEQLTPKNMEEAYNLLGSGNTMSVRFLPDRLDEVVQARGVTPKQLEARDAGVREVPVGVHDNLSEETQVIPKEESTPELETDEGETLDEPDGQDGKVKDGASIRLEEDKEEREEPVESYVEKIARLNHVKPAVVNTRIIENFEKVEEDTGIPLKGIYARGEVIAVRIPYKLGYRTFLAEKSTGMTIDGKGRKDRSSGRYYDFNEIEDYFRFKLRDGHDGGDSGKPLTRDEGRDYTTYLDENGEIKEQKFINNGKKQDMLREERTKYLTEVAEADQKLKDAIDEYQKHATHENYQKVREIIQEKVEIDNKYNALDEQRKITEKTKENAEKVIGKDLDDDDDDWFPQPGSRFHH